MVVLWENTSATFVYFLLCSNAVILWTTLNLLQWKLHYLKLAYLLLCGTMLYDKSNIAIVNFQCKLCQKICFFILTIFRHDQSFHYSLCLFLFTENLRFKTSQEKNSDTHVYAILKSIVKNMSEMKFCTFQGGKWPSY